MVVLAVIFSVAACSDDGGSGSDDDGGDGGTTTFTSGSGGSGGSGTGTTTGTGTGTTTGTGGNPGDPYEAARIACVDKINELRATQGKAPYARWVEAEGCSDQQATSDESSGNAHGAFGQCGENGQNECTGGGVDGMAGCLDSMWAEKDQADCGGCDACADSYNPNCANCDFFGDQNGQVCGHYVNMSANYFTKAACGFSSLGGWAVINFSP
jgi:hypothetical protein